ncbi:MAG: DNA-binding response regulator [Gammaproteobacteria bacterium]
MIDVVIIDNENVIARFIDQGTAKVTVYDDEIRALNAIEETKPSIIFVHHKVNESAIKELIRALFKTSMQSRIILIGRQIPDEEVLDCLASGIKGYLQTHDVERFINKLIRVTMEGEAWVSRRLVSKLLDRLHQPSEGESSQHTLSVS